MTLNTARVGDLFPKIRIGGTPSRGNPLFFGGDHIWVSIRDMEGTSLITNSAETLSDTGVANSNCKLIREGSLLFSFKLTVGRVAFAGTNLYTNEAIAAFDVDDAEANNVDLEYLSLVLPPIARGDTTKNSMGAALLSKERIANLRIPLPQIAEQRRIAAQLQAQLAAVERARAAARMQLAETEALQLAIYRDAFAGIVPVTVPPTFEAAPAGWHWAKLADIAQLESGHTPSRSRPDWWGGDVSWLSLTEIRALDGRWVDETQIRTNEAGIANSSARILPRGTVCFSRTASVGFVAIMGQPMATSQDFANWVCGDELDPEFLMHALIRSRQELRAIATGATHHTIYMPALASFHLCLPDRSAQQRIIAGLKQQLAALEQLHAAAQAQLADIEQLPARLLAQAFNPTDEGTSP